jgi:YebC/PmpR family DNA-binding regulatory protein
VASAALARRRRETVPRHGERRQRSQRKRSRKDEEKMAGHSKWANIQHRKGRQDAKRGKVFTKLIKEVTVAAKMGGGDPAMNPRLRLAIDKAKAESMPKDNIENAIRRGTGQLEGVSYEEVRYEGYGIGGAAVMVDCLTDNKTRTVAEVRHAFAKHGGNMGAEGSVAFQFKHCGQLVFAPGADEARLMDAAIEAGAEDVVSDDDGSIEILTAPTHEFSAVKEALEAAGLRAEFAEITMKPQNETPLSGDEATKMQKLIDALEDLDDVQSVYTTAVFDE